MAEYIAISVWGYCFICYKGTPRPDNEIKQDTILTPFLCSITKPFRRGLGTHKYRMQIKKLLILASILLTAVCGTYAQTSIDGVWGIKFGESENSVMQKLNAKYPGRPTKEGGGILVKDVRLGDQLFEGAAFMFNNNQLRGILFTAIYQYENSFTSPITFNEAQKWLDDNRPKIKQTANRHIVEMLASKYGTQSRGSSDSYAFWKDSNGNFIEVLIDEALDTMHDQQFYNQYGAVPGFMIQVAYVKNEGNNDF
ncbi:hypothetical protein [Bacteroides acidifaciens]|uniref:hypothetical protein n=1 Tax=Bacteroides acidifaciens TaxID=85831 RepID=UPI0025AA2A50|nr:hypothetical protein [Bacteroides acidifaciens]